MNDWEEQYSSLLAGEDNVEIIKKDVAIGDALILQQMAKQPHLFAKWAYFESRIDETVRIAEAEYKAVLAEARNSIRSEGKISVAACEDRATVMPQVRLALTSLNLLQAKQTLIKQVTRGMAQKRDMLMSINSRQKAEMEMER